MDVHVADLVFHPMVLSDDAMFKPPRRVHLYNKDTLKASIEQPCFETINELSLELCEVQSIMPDYMKVHVPERVASHLALFDTNARQVMYNHALNGQGNMFRYKPLIDEDGIMTVKLDHSTKVLNGNKLSYHALIAMTLQFNGMHFGGDNHLLCPIATKIIIVHDDAPRVTLSALARFKHRRRTTKRMI